MQGFLVLSACLVLSCSASPVVQKVEQAPALKQEGASELASFAYAVDLSAPVSVAGFQCILSNLYKVAFIRLFFSGREQFGPFDPAKRRSAFQQYGLTIGIYTNINEWNQITGAATINNAMLWYWNTYGSGVSNETPANFNDFRSFAGWTSPSVKQFAQVESVCGITVNRDIYSLSSAAVAGMSKREKSDQITVGGLGLGGAAILGKPEIRQ
ncbi:hypothetical protein GCK32_017313 [Trichostrongylus colubriformis]|uniref:Uncharacterized protein n=1 Tax=Trichostrongylus colubriformis TaxID=6319 RepID=A0AAN8ICP8_TRICO